MSAGGLLLDSGALIAFERARRTIGVILDEAIDDDLVVHVPSVVVAEAWRGGRRSARIARLLAGCIIQPLGLEDARSAGEALAAVRGASTIDAIVAASASRLGLPIVTSDPDDMSALATHFGGLALIAI